jgi:TatD DNase family protein
MLLIDVHAHLDHPALTKKIDNIIARAEKAGIKAIITNGITPATNRMALALAKKYKNVYCALGIYPPDALRREIAGSEYPIGNEEFDIDSEIKWIEKQIKANKKVLAIGEVGLDYSDEKADKALQRETFQKLIALSEKTHKPLIIHSRKAEEDVVEMINSSKVKYPIFHCFSGKFRLVKKIQEKGWLFSIPTNIVRSQQFQQIALTTNLSQILTETDAPYLSPFKEKDNEPAFIAESIKKIADLKRMTPEELSNQIYMNFQRVFF